MLDCAKCVCACVRVHVCTLRQQREKPRGKLSPEHGLEARTVCVCVCVCVKLSPEHGLEARTLCVCS